MPRSGVRHCVVMRFWRMALINQPRVWSAIFITQEDCRSFVEMCVERSYPVALDVTLEASRIGWSHVGTHPFLISYHHLPLWVGWWKFSFTLSPPLQHRVRTRYRRTRQVQNFVGTQEKNRKGNGAGDRATSPPLPPFTPQSINESSLPVNSTA